VRPEASNGESYHNFRLMFDFRVWVSGIAGELFLTPAVCYIASRMRATQQLKYAIYGIFDIAYNGGDRSVSVVAIGARQGIPPRYLEQIFQKLRRAGLVTSKRGPGGGYQLSRSPETISLADIVYAVQGQLLALPGNGATEDQGGPAGGAARGRPRSR